MTSGSSSSVVWFKTGAFDKAADWVGRGAKVGVLDCIWFTGGAWIAAG